LGKHFLQDLKCKNLFNAPGSVAVIVKAATFCSFTKKHPLKNLKEKEQQLPHCFMPNSWILTPILRNVT
jgi:hypothetical protein